jgi:hypothetical protein
LSTRNVVPELYDFLKENETGLCRDKRGVRGYVHIYFFNLAEFVEIVGTGPFDEGGREVQMFTNTICIDINEIIEGYDQTLLDYKNCFNESDWENYREEIEKEAK